MSPSADGLNVHIRRLGLRPPTAALIQEMRLQVPPGQILTIMGPSGCGKSSLLAAISGTLGLVAEGQTPLAFDGEVWLHGQDLSQRPPHQRQIGLLFQDALLFSHWTVAENLAFALPVALARQRSQAHQAIEAALARAGLAGLGDRDPSTLSGGQQARVALMRALLAEPRALLLDEPFSRLDVALRRDLRPWVFEEIRQRQIPAILVTHDPDDIADPAHLLHLDHAR
jgi:putative thiamine transport system ATP-binding protein